MNLQIRDIEETDLRQILRPRPADGHKGTFGHALLAAGSRGMAGAAILAAEACLRSGTGKLTVVTPDINRPLLQVSIPEAIVINPEGLSPEAGNFIAYDAVGLGPGLGTDEEATRTVHDLLTNYRWNITPMVIDADAINILARHHEWWGEALNCHRILTPHPGEAIRLIQSARPEDVSLFAREFKVTIVLKGHTTRIFDEFGNTYRLRVGNSGMATAGSGDVLTGIITGLLAQEYRPLEAAMLGVWLHGTAGDHAAAELTEHCMLARDITRHLPEAFGAIKN